MKQFTSQTEFDSLPLLNQLFLAIWKKEKGYTPDKALSFGQLIELSFALTNDFKYETPPERSTFNNSLQYEEIFLGWDGNEPIDILWYEINQKLKRRIIQYMVSISK